MNDLRLLKGLLCAVTLSVGSCAFAQRVISLDEIFASAEKSSAQLKPSFSAETESALDIEVARAQRLPEVSATMSVSFIGDGFITKRNFSGYEKAPIPHLGTGLEITISQPIYTGGAITSSINLAELKSTAARFATDLKRDNIRFELTGYYLDLYKCFNLQSVVASNIESAKKLLDDMKARYEQGTVLLNDITRYELLLSNLELQQVKLSNTIAILNNNLVTLAGLGDSVDIIPDTTILAQSLPVHGEGWWQSEAESKAPALQLARNGVEMSRKAEALVKSDRLPKVGINAGWTMDGPILVEIPPINRNLSYWYVGVGVSYNISSLYKNNRSVAKSNVATQKAVYDLDATYDKINTAVRADYIRYMESYEDLKTQQKSVELAERNYNTVETRYSEGMALITDMLDAADSRLNAQQQLVNARINIIYYYYKLLFTSGKI